ncbi:PilW family protein [Desulfonatronospira thiodismutans]|nr:prepilin-type N-terminal cleavage/methylation domain-containing protein [Desulfonatronospira thiodismutans]
MKIDKNIFRWHSNGLTLIELLIVLVVMSLIMGGLVSTFISHSRISAAEAARMEVQQNMRVSVDRLKHVLRHAGFGCYASFAQGLVMSGDDPEGDTINISTFIDDDTKSNQFESDSVIIVYGFKVLGKVAEVLNDDEINLNKKPSPSITTQNDFKQYLSFFPGLAGNSFYEVYNVSDKDITFTSDLPISEEDLQHHDVEVYMVSPARIFIKDNNLQVQIFAYQRTAVDREQHWIVAENIEDISFQYYENGTWHDDDSTIGDMNNIRKIRFSLQGRSKEKVNGEYVRMESHGEVTLRNVF